MGDNEWQTCTCQYSKVQCHQSSWKITSVRAHEEVPAQLIIHAVRIVCIALSCAHVIAMKSPRSIGDQGVLSYYAGDDDDDGDDE